MELAAVEQHSLPTDIEAVLVPCYLSRSVKDGRGVEGVPGLGVKLCELGRL